MQIDLISGDKDILQYGLTSCTGAKDLVNGDDGEEFNVIYRPGPDGDAGGAAHFDGTPDAHIDIASSNIMDVQFSYTLIMDVFIGKLLGVPPLTFFVLIITTYWHIPRSIRLAKDTGIIVFRYIPVHNDEFKTDSSE